MDLLAFDKEMLTSSSRGRGGAADRGAEGGDCTTGCATPGCAFVMLVFKDSSFWFNLASMLVMTLSPTDWMNALQSSLS